jgi:hypothetical protein
MRDASQVAAAGTPAADPAAPAVAPSDPPADDSGDAADSGSDWFARTKEIAGFIAPTTAITALLIYFGYVGTRARFAYFGVYLDLTELSNQNLVLYGLEVLYVPAALALLALLAGAACHAAVGWLVSAPDRSGTALTVAAFAALGGVLLTARALIGILVVQVAQTEVPGTSALALALGPVLLVYAGWIAATVLSRRTGRSVPAASFAAGHVGARSARLRRLTTVVVGGLVLVGLFWAANSFAWAFGQGRAVEDALGLPAQPEVVLDTKEALVDLPQGITEVPLPTDAEQAFRYRYRGLRLLLAAGDRLFLVPAHWTEEGRTLVVPYDDEIRIQLIPSPQSR